jgi:hypothetical protein
MSQPSPPKKGHFRTFSDIRESKRKNTSPKMMHFVAFIVMLPKKKDGESGYLDGEAD